MLSHENCSAEQRALWARIAAHPFEDRRVLRDFTTRLAESQKCSRPKAQGLIAEYRRFCFLAIAAGHEVCPSEAVDAVWHLHLTETRDYWGVFCPEVLGTALHHRASTGGKAQAGHHRETYAKTLASYQRFFGPPPACAWPAMGIRFSSLMPGTAQRLAARIKRLLAPLAQRLTMVLVLMLMASPLALAASPNPLNMKGPEFLLLYMMLLAAATALTLIMQSQVKRSDSGMGNGTLDVWEAAYLGGGARRVLDAAAAKLIAEGQAEPHLAAHCLSLTEGTRELPSPLRHYAQLLARPNALKQSEAALAGDLLPLQGRLQQRGLLLSDDQRRRFRALPLPWLGPVMALGVGKLVVGLMRDKPVALLVVLLVLSALVLILLRNREARASLAGQRALAAYTRANSHLRQAPGNADLAVAVAVGAGAAAFAGTAFADYYRYRNPASSGDGNSPGSMSSDSSSADSSESGGGSGCGGCGGD